MTSDAHSETSGILPRRRWLHWLWHYPLSSWPVIDLAGDQPAYAMQGLCDNCGINIAIVQAVGESIPGFTSRWSKLTCPKCGTDNAYGVFDMDLKAVRVA